jgi:hypothetical protein
MNKIPYSEDAETALIGALLIDGEIIGSIALEAPTRLYLRPCSD